MNMTFYVCNVNGVGTHHDLQIRFPDESISRLSAQCKRCKAEFSETQIYVMCSLWIKLMLSSGDMEEHLRWFQMLLLDAFTNMHSQPIRLKMLEYCPCKQ